MQHSRAVNILSGQSNLARRVFAAVPMQQFWDIQQISNEMKRLEPHNLSKGEIMGCLRTLVDAGLINETASMTFRSAVKPPKETPVAKATTSAEPVKKLPLLSRFADLADKLRTLADDLDDLAVEADQAVSEAGQDTEKLKELQGTLRKLMG